MVAKEEDKAGEVREEGEKEVVLAALVAELTVVDERVEVESGEDMAEEICKVR